MGIRLHALAKELGITSKQLMVQLSSQGIEMKNVFCVLDDALADRVRREGLSAEAPPVKDETAPAPEAAPPKAPAPRPPKARAPAKAPPQEEPKVVKGPPSKDGLPPVGARIRLHEGRGKVRVIVSDAGQPIRQGQLPPVGPTMPRVPPRRPTRDRVRDHHRAPSRESAGVAPPVRPTKVQVGLPVTVKDLSASIGIKVSVLLRQLMMNKITGVNVNTYLDRDTIELLGLENNVEVDIVEKTDVEEAIRAIESAVDREEDLVSRAPIVAFLGHVDHGKTSLLDKIRQTNVQAHEAGGITQNIGAYRVDKGDQHVVFLDTPGHEAFTAMRARGANVTDVAVLVVAADDGPMPQTEEAISHARAADVPIVVAVNKIDLPTANVLRAKQRLAELGLIPPEWGGNTEIVEVSAVTSQGIDELLEVLSLESQILNLRANPAKNARGVVLEAESSKGRGVLAHLLPLDGTLRVGDCVLCGAAHGRVRGMWTSGGRPVTEAGPAVPVEITGLSQVPEAGERFYVLDDPQEARRIAEDRQRRVREAERAERHFDRMHPFADLEKIKELRIILKADTKGSIEALRKQLLGLSTDEIQVRLLHSGVGGINEGDISLAQVSGATVLGFRVIPDDRARHAAEEKGVEVRTYQVIYDAAEDVRRTMESRLAPIIREVVRGHAEIRKIIPIPRVGNVAGSYVTDGAIARSDQARLVREGRVIYTGAIESLKRVKDDAREVKAGFECGIKIRDYDDIKEGDVIESFHTVEERRTL